MYTKYYKLINIIQYKIIICLKSLFSIITKNFNIITRGFFEEIVLLPVL